MRVRTANWPRDLAFCCMSPPPCLTAVLVGLPALDSCLLVFGLVDVVCPGPVSLFPGLSPFVLIDVVCLGPVFPFPGWPIVWLDCQLWCAWFAWVCTVWARYLTCHNPPTDSLRYSSHGCHLLEYALFGLGILPATLHRLTLYDTPPMVVCSGTLFLWWVFLELVLSTGSLFMWKFYDGTSRRPGKCRDSC